MTPKQEAALRHLIAWRGDRIQAKLPGHLHHLTPFKVEVFGNLTKYTLGEARPGVWAMLHHIEGSDCSDGPHDHPCRFDSYGIQGGYWERVYFEDGRTEETLRAAGGHHTIWPHTVHEVRGIVDGPVWTLVLAYEVEREARHYPELAAIRPDWRPLPA